MSTLTDAWPEATSELLPHTLFKLADSHSDMIYAEYFTDSADLTASYRKITYQQYANAVHATAWWIEKNIGKPKVQDGRETLVYLGDNDLRYGALTLAAVMVGYNARYCSYQTSTC